jgi:hypothetical protein
VTATLLTLGDVLRSVDVLSWDHAVYLPTSEEWNERSLAVVLDPDDAGDDEEEPAAARAHGLKYALDVATLQDIVANAREQQQDIDVPGLLRAVVYYYENDAFIALT